jgi:hypothetical protein
MNHTAAARSNKVERFRPQPELLEPQAQPKAKRTPKKQRSDNSILFLPNNIWDCPVLPLVHRGDDDETKFTLREFAGLVACLVTGRRKLAAMQNAEAWEAGKLGIEAKRPSKRASGKKIRQAGRNANRRRRQTLKANIPEIVSVEVTKHTFLRAGGIAANGKAMRKLPDILHRLTQPFAINSKRKRPILRSWKTLPDGRLQLEIHADQWLPDKRFARIPLPLPTQGAGVSAVMLHVFLFAVVAAGGSHIGQIRRAALCQRLGIKPAAPSHQNHAIRKALAVVNTNLARLDRAVFNKKARVDCPLSFTLKDSGDWMKFVAQQDHRDADYEHRRAEGVLPDKDEQQWDEPAQKQQEDAVRDDQLSQDDEGTGEQEADKPVSPEAWQAWLKEKKYGRYAEPQDDDGHEPTDNGDDDDY